MYHGETPVKKLARAIAYDVASRETRLVDGGIVCLAGPEAHDVGPISHFFPGVAADRVLFVDEDERGIEAAGRRMPGAMLHLGSLSTVEPPWPVRLAVLDLCGHLTGENLVGVSRVIRRLAFNGVVLLTTLRARETSGVIAKAIKKNSVESCPCCRPVINSRIRVGGALGLMASALGVAPSFAGSGIRGRLVQRVLSEIGVIHYNGPSSPMLMTIAKLERLVDARRRLENAVVSQADEMLKAVDGGASWSDLGKMLGGEVWGVREAMRRSCGPADLLRRGYPAAAYDVSPGTLAAWRAHRTMGTYDQAVAK